MAGLPLAQGRSGVGRSAGIVSVLHIGKTGGTVVKHVLQAHANRRCAKWLRLFKHDMTLPRLCEEFPESRVVFFVRDPMERFVSGFNSRLRQGRPRYHSPWSRAERRAFALFSAPNRLAEALSEEDDCMLPAARDAMASIGHIAHPLAYYLGSVELLEQNRDRILFIGDQRHFDEDLARLRAWLVIDADIAAPTDAVGAHRNPPGANRFLSERAQANLRAWYAADYTILEWCRRERGRLIASRSPDKWAQQLSAGLD